MNVRIPLRENPRIRPHSVSTMLPELGATTVRELQRKRREFQEDLSQRRNEELAAVVERANRVIKQIFDQDKYDLILQEVIFAGPRVDITDKVIKALNAAPAATPGR